MRSKWKGIFLHPIIYKFANIKSSPNFSKSWLDQKINIRSSIFIKQLCRRTLFIHNGKNYVRIKFFKFENKNIKLGQFTYNRIFPARGVFTENRARAYLKIMSQRGGVRRKKTKHSKELIV